MELYVQLNMDHFIKDLFANILSAQHRINSEIEYEGLFQMVAADLRAAKYCWDELFKIGDDKTTKIMANEHEIQLRKKIASLMHASNILVESQHMIEQRYKLPSTQYVKDVTLKEVREEFEKLNELIDQTLQSRDLYQNNKLLKDFFTVWDGGMHMHAFVTIPEEEQKRSI